MVLVGIDVAKDKHDCFIMSSKGEVLANVFTVSNSWEGFDCRTDTDGRKIFDIDHFAGAIPPNLENLLELLNRVEAFRSMHA